MILPRLIRFRDAPAYLGMDRNRFNAEVRPHITEVPMGVQGVAFDRLDLDAWVYDYGRRAAAVATPTPDACPITSAPTLTAMLELMQSERQTVAAAVTELDRLRTTAAILLAHIRAVRGQNDASIASLQSLLDTPMHTGQALVQR